MASQPPPARLLKFAKLYSYRDRMPPHDLHGVELELEAFREPKAILTAN